MSTQFVHRKLTPEEADSVQRGRLGLHGVMETLLAPILPGGCITILGYLAFGGIAALLKALHVVEPPFPQWLLGTFLILPLVAGLVCGWIYQGGLRRAQRALRTDLRWGDVEVTTLKASRVIQQDSDDEAAELFYYDLGDRKVLFLLGTWAPESAIKEDSRGEIQIDRKKRLPSTLFAVHRLPGSGFVLRVDVLGDPLEPLGRLPVKLILPAQWEKVGHHKNIYREYALFEGDFDELLPLMEPPGQI